MPEAVLELPGSYGPIRVPERELQRLWASASPSARALTTREGRRLRILSPGRWNQLEGPDFIDATLEIDGERRHGDVEIHFREEDWEKHGHAVDPNFANVILHVFLYPGRGSLSGRPPEALEWLKYLETDLESHLEACALESLLVEGTPAALQPLLGMPVADRERAFHLAARERWDRKVACAGARLARHGWAESCHQVLLETLGLKRNRAAFGTVAERYPLERWPDNGPVWEDLRDDPAITWHLAGVRPANKPDRRLRAYSAFVRGIGRDWPTRIRPPAGIWRTDPWPPGQRFSVPELRRDGGLLRQRESWFRFFEAVCRGTRFETWITDGLLPLLAVGDDRDFFRYWFAWPPGDIPDACASHLRALGIGGGPGSPRSNGWFQGLLRFGEPGA